MKKAKNTNETEAPEVNPGLLDIITKTTNSSFDPAQILQYLKVLEAKVDVIAKSIEESYKRGQDELLLVVSKETETIKSAIAETRKDYLRLEAEINTFRQVKEAASIFSRVITVLKGIFSRRGGK